MDDPDFADKFRQLFSSDKISKADHTPNTSNL